MSNYSLTCLAIFGMLLIVTVAVVAASSLLLSVTKIVSVSATTTPSGANETTTATGGSSNNMTGAQFLFILNADSGSAIEVNDTTSILQLSNVSDKTISFSDRPNRIVTTSNTTDFIGNWSTGPDSFAVDPPNALLVLDNVLQRLDLSEIQLFNPEYDSEANTLKYDITTENATSINLPDKFGLTTLVIDEHGYNGYNIGYNNGEIDRPDS